MKKIVIVPQLLFLTSLLTSMEPESNSAIQSFMKAFDRPEMAQRGLHTMVQNRMVSASLLEYLKKLNPKLDLNMEFHDVFPEYFKKEETNYDSVTPLMLAVQHGECSAIQLLLDAGALCNHQNHYGSTALHWAVCTEKIKTISFLIKCGAQLNTQNSQKQTPLHRAIHSWPVTTVNPALKMLYFAGADISIRDKDNQTAYEKAVALKLFEAVTFFESIEKK